MSSTKYGSDFHASAELHNIILGSKADYYIHENVEEIVEHGEKRYAGKMYVPHGWYAIVEWNDHDEMRDFGANAKASKVVSGPYLTKEEAIAAAEPYVDKIREQYE